MRKEIVAAILMLSHLAYAGSASSVIIAAGYREQGPAVRMRMQADYVAVPVSIQSDASDPVERGDEIEKTYRLLMEKLAAQADLKVMPGLISLSPGGQSKSSGKSFSKSFSSSYAGGDSAQFYVLGALKPETNIFGVTKRIHALLAQTALPDGARMALGNTVLGLDEPEQYRNQLLGLIAKSMVDARKALGPTGVVDVEGLENPVTVMQMNDREVMLFISYRLRIQTKAP